MTTDSITGAEAAVAMLRLHGVEFIFGLCGDTSLPFYDALARLPHGMRHILARDERSAAYMADGYARVSAAKSACAKDRAAAASLTSFPALPEAERIFRAAPVHQ